MKNRLTKEEVLKLRNLNLQENKNLVDFDDILDQKIGVKGSAEREDFEAKSKAWYYAEVLKERRKSLGITQKTLGEMVNRERTYINRVEKGETDLQLSSFIRISAALGMKISLSIE